MAIYVVRGSVLVFLGKIQVVRPRQESECYVMPTPKTPPHQSTLFSLTVPLHDGSERLLIP